MKKALLIIAKRPAKGQTKTRLSPPLLGEEAAELYENFLQDMLDTVRAVPNVERFIHYWPSEAETYFRQIGPDFDLLPQQGASLGERLNQVLTHCLTTGFDQAIITNSDSPTLPVSYLVQAFDLLNTVDVILGPCDDGGYYLIGLKHPQPRLLLDVTMSTPQVTEDTLALAAEEGLQTALLPTWYDVDTIAEMNRLRKELVQAAETVAPRTRQFLQQLR